MHALLELDHFVQTLVVGHRSGVLDGVMTVASAVGRGGIIWLAAAAILTATRRLRLADFGRLSLALLAAWISADLVLKPAVNRQRPFLATPHAASSAHARPGDASFPSGHAAAAFAGAFVLSRLVPVSRIVWWILAVMIAYARVYLGVHYPLDVIGGALVGVACGAVVMFGQTSKPLGPLKVPFS